MLHEERHGATLCVAYEASVGVAAALLWHRRGSDDEVAVVLVVVEGTQAREVHASLAEGHVAIAHYVLNLGRVLYALNDVVGDFWHRA